MRFLVNDMKLAGYFKKLNRRNSLLGRPVLYMSLLVILCAALTGCGTNGPQSVDEQEQISQNGEAVIDIVERNSAKEDTADVDEESEEEASDDEISDSLQDEIGDEEEISEEAEEEDMTEESAESENDDSGEEEVTEPEGPITVDLIMFMGQSNMSGCGGNASVAPKVNEGAGYEFRSVSDPTRLYPIDEPFGDTENYLGAIMELQGEKKGSLVSSFVNTYYEATRVPVVAISASKGATTTRDWLSEPFMNDVKRRYTRAREWLTANNYEIRKQYVVWLQGESDADKGIGPEEYATNMDEIIRPLFIDGIQKVFVITPGRTLSRKEFFKDIINVQIQMCKDSGYYALATTVLSGMPTECMTDEWHYNQYALNVVGEEAARSAAYYSNNQKEMCVFNYHDGNTFIPEGFDYPSDTQVEPIDLSDIAHTGKENVDEQ